MEMLENAGVDLAVPVRLMGGHAGLVLGGCLGVLRLLPDNSVDAVVTDPPYGLSFMGKRWDYDVPAVEVWAEYVEIAHARILHAMGGDLV
jgi:DNA modification methylase